MSDDVVYRREAIDTIAHATFDVTIGGRRGFIDYKKEFEKAFVAIRDKYIEALKALPSATLERDIPMKPMETTDRTWGIPARQPVCPKCDYYLSNIVFIGDGKRVTYCEHCGQAIDWEGWDAECSE